jgi:membrane-associated phospholipid phosphatase
MKQLMSRLNRFDSIIFISIAILAFAAVLSYFFIDNKICLWVSSKNAKIDNFTGADLLKSLGKVYVPLWLLFLFGYIKKNVQLVIAASLSVLMALAMKIMIKRERPREIYNQQTTTDDPHVAKSRSHDQSFPSSDTAAIFAHAAVVTPLISSLSIPVVYILAIVVGILRILALAHYPSDVLTGAAIGILCGWFAIKLSRIWASENKFRINEWWKLIVYAGFMVIPVLTFFAGGIGNLIVFFLACGILSALVYILSKMQTYL